MPASPNQRTALVTDRPDRPGHASLEMTARYYHANEKTLQATAATLPVIGKANALPVAGAKLEAVLAGLEGLSKEDLKKVGGRVKEMIGN